MLIWLINSNTKQNLMDNIRHNRNLYFFHGIVLLFLGIVSLFVPLLAAEILNVLIGCLLVLAGLFQILINYSAAKHWTFYFTGIISLLVGILLIVHPQVGILAITTVISIFLFIQGCVQIFYVGIYAPFRGWKWMLASGVINIALTLFIYFYWPTSAAWFLGIAIGINLIAFGIALLMLTNYLGKD